MKIVVYLLLSISFAAYGAPEGEIEKLKKRIEDLEKQQEQLFLGTTEPRTDVHSFLRDNLTLGGFYETGFNFIAGDDTETQGANDANIIGLNISADFAQDFRFVSQLIGATNIPLENRHNDPSAQPRKREYNTYVPIAAVTQGYVEYSWSRLYNLEMGIGYVPIGFALQLRDPVLYLRRGGHQIVRTPGLASILWQGVHLNGSKNLHKGQLGYNLYTFTPTSNVKLPGLGGRVWAANDNEKIIGGLSAQVAESDEETFSLFGADVRFDYYPYLLRTEVLQKFTQNSDSWAMYVEPGYFIYQEEVLLYAFGDYAFAPQNETGRGSAATEDPFQRWEYGAGVNWLPTSYTRFRFGLTVHDYVGNRARIERINRDYYSMDLSVGVAF